MSEENTVERQHLTVREIEALRLLAKAWDVYVKLPILHPDDVADFRRAIHAAQNIVMARGILDPNRELRI